VLADFDDEVERTEEHASAFASFLARVCMEDKLAPLDREAVGLTLEIAVRWAGDRDKISTHLSEVADLIREADFHRRTEGEAVVGRAHIAGAFRTRERRHGRIEERTREMMHQEVLKIATSGERVGVVNGLSVHQLGGHAFGRPTRITASVSLGRGGILNIEREASLSGSTHDKGVLILGGFLRERYAQDRPLGLQASLAFEQSYSEIDGDSASSTECYALLSQLSGLPLKQSIAVTGSINQKGEIQAIGGANEKIEGFFNVCKERGLDGTHGVIIPEANVRHLALRSEVVEAAKEGKFQIWSASTVDEGIEILTGKPSGERQEDGSYPEGTVNGLVDARLAEMAEEMRLFFEEAALGGDHPPEPEEGGDEGAGEPPAEE